MESRNKAGSEAFHGVVRALSILLIAGACSCVAVRADRGAERPPPRTEVPVPAVAVAMRTFPLEHVPAEEVAQILRDLIDASRLRSWETSVGFCAWYRNPPDQRDRADTLPRFESCAESNTLIVLVAADRAEDLDRIADLVGRLDADPRAAPRG